jgi:glyoxylase-like metal-dependent hydrolase (beta-lactamase superfamily II)
MQNFRIYETPGHSPCSIAAYIQRSKALFASDSVGIPFKNMIDTSPSYDYAQYLESVEKIKHLAVEYICADHYGYVGGSEAMTFVKQTIVACKKGHALMEKTYRRTKNVERAVEEWISIIFRENPDYFIF